MKIIFIVIIVFFASLEAKAQVNPRENFDEGIRAFYDMKYNDAIKYFNIYIQGMPNDYQGYMYKGLSYMGLKLYQDAQDQLDNAVRLQPFNSELLTYRGYLFLFRDMPERCDKDFTDAITSDINNIHAYMGKAINDFNEDKYQIALRFFDAAESLQVTSYWLYFMRGLCYLYLDDSTRAYTDLEKSISLDPSNSLVNTSYSRQMDRNLILIYYAIILNVLDNFNEDIEKAPNNFIGYLGRAFVYLDLRKYDLAEDDIRIVQKLYKGNSQSLLSLIAKIRDNIKRYR